MEHWCTLSKDTDSGIEPDWQGKMVSVIRDLGVLQCRVLAGLQT